MKNIKYSLLMALTIVGTQCFGMNSENHNFPGLIETGAIKIDYKYPRTVNEFAQCGPWIYDNPITYRFQLEETTVILASAEAVIRGVKDGETWANIANAYSDYYKPVFKEKQMKPYVFIPSVYVDEKFKGTGLTQSFFLKFLSNIKKEYPNAICFGQLRPFENQDTLKTTSEKYRSFGCKIFKSNRTQEELMKIRDGAAELLREIGGVSEEKIAILTADVPSTPFMFYLDLEKFDTQQKSKL